MNELELTKLLREQAARNIPEFDSNGWFANLKGPGLFRVMEGAYLEFGLHRYSLDLTKKTSYGVDIDILSDLRGKGLGRRLVKIQEVVCQQMGIERVVIEMNENPSFWIHMGYSPMSTAEIAKFTSEFGVKIIDTCEGSPVYKKLI